MSKEPRVVADGLIFPEGPRWHELAFDVEVPHAGFP